MEAIWVAGAAITLILIVAPAPAQEAATLAKDSTVDKGGRRLKNTLHTISKLPVEVEPA
jgi:hypothetical protein